MLAVSEIREITDAELDEISGGPVPLLLLVFGAAFALGLTATIAAGSGEIAANGK